MKHSKAVPQLKKINSKLRVSFVLTWPCTQHQQRWGKRVTLLRNYFFPWSSHSVYLTLLKVPELSNLWHLCFYSAEKDFFTSWSINYAPNRKMLSYKDCSNKYTINLNMTFEPLIGIHILLLVRTRESSSQAWPLELKIHSIWQFIQTSRFICPLHNLHLSFLLLLFLNQSTNLSY